MKIVVPFTNLHPVTKAVLESYKLKINYYELDDRDNYRRLLKTLWEENETVILIEHDIVPWHGAIEELYNCPCHWDQLDTKLYLGVKVLGWKPHRHRPPVIHLGEREIGPTR